MNISSLIGLAGGASVLFFALSATADDFSFFLDFHGILIVVGGTAAASSIAFPVMDVLLLIKVFIKNVLGYRKPVPEKIISQIIELNKKASISMSAVGELLPQIKHKFLKEAVELLVNGVLTEDELKSVLMTRVGTLERKYAHEAGMFRVIGRFPPAFGLLATTLGMIGLLQKIGQADSQKLIGPAMSVGLIGTLYGIALANLVFIPIAENLTVKGNEEIELRRMIIHGVLLIKKKVNPISIREYLNSYLSPRQRLQKKPAKGPVASGA
jgi:chemotaxis protein MotA